VNLTPDPSLPKVFGRYLLVRRLSRGGMGEIFLAKSGQLTGFEKLCVIKKILPHLAEDGEFIRRFIDEASVAIQLSHANIAPVFEVGMVEGEYFLALEYVEGRDLRRALGRLGERRQRLPLELALWIVREVASGLAYAHRRTNAEGQALGVVHCDISPPNVVLSYEGDVKIIDFGIAKSAMRITETNPKMGFGKFGYMAPEQLIRGGVVDRRTDIYAAGVLLYELTTGERLFQFGDGVDYKAIARAVASGQHPLPSHRDPALAELDPIAQRALAPDQAKRYSYAEQLRDDVQVALVRVNPTLTADRLGAFVRQLFADEVAEERSLLAQASAVDLTPYQNELTGARTHTVSFALSQSTTGGTPTPIAKEQVSGGTMLVEKAAARRPNRAVMLATGVGVTSLVAGAALAFVFAGRGGAKEKPGKDPTAEVQPPAQQVVVQQPIMVKEMAAQPSEPPTIAMDPEPMREDPSPSHPTPHPPIIKKTAPKPTPDPPAAPASQAEVQAKFRSVKGEYAGFKKRYGGRLESEWNDILDTATYATGGDKYKKLDAKLDQFRKRMASIQHGG
jgi:serine/threonine protein kinase